MFSYLQFKNFVPLLRFNIVCAFLATEERKKYIKGKLGRSQKYEKRGTHRGWGDEIHRQRKVRQPGKTKNEQRTKLASATMEDRARSRLFLPLTAVRLCTHPDALPLTNLSLPAVCISILLIIISKRERETQDGTEE